MSNPLRGPCASADSRGVETHPAPVPTCAELATKVTGDVVTDLGGNPWRKSSLGCWSRPGVKRSPVLNDWQMSRVLAFVEGHRR